MITLPALKQPPTHLVFLGNGAERGDSNPSPRRPRFQARRQVSFRQLRSRDGKFERSVRLHRESQHRQNSENEDRDGCPVQNLPVNTLVAVQTASGTGRESCKCNKKKGQSGKTENYFVLGCDDAARRRLKLFLFRLAKKQ